MNSNLKRTMAFIFIALCAFFLSGCSSKYVSVSKYDIGEMDSILSGENNTYSIDEYFDAIDTLYYYFEKDMYDKEIARDAYKIVDEYVDDILFSVDEVLTMLVNY